MHKRNRRRPSPEELIAAAYNRARWLFNLFDGDRIGAPILAAIHPDRLMGGGRTTAPIENVAARHQDEAVATLKYLDESGDMPGATAESIAIDRKVFEEIAHRRDRKIGRRPDRNAPPTSNREIAAAVGLSHDRVGKRRKARVERIMKRLHADAPSLWQANGRPVAGPTMSDGNVLRLAA